MDKKKPFFNFTSTLGRIVLLGLVILFLVNIGRSIYKNHNIKKQITELESQNHTLKNEKLNLENRILYYDTQTYKELEARKHLNYKKKGEKVVSLITQEDKASEENKIINDFKTQNKKSSDDPSPNWQKWWQYIFG